MHGVNRLRSHLEVKGDIASWVFHDGFIDRLIGDQTACEFKKTAPEALGAVVITDGLQELLRALPASGIATTGGSFSGAESPRCAALPRVHRVASLLKRWLLGTHQGAVRRELLDYYLDEFTFRFNCRTSRHSGLLFYRLMETGGPLPYAGGEPPRTSQCRLE